MPRDGLAFAIQNRWTILLMVAATQVLPYVLWGTTPFLSTPYSDVLVAATVLVLPFLLRNQRWAVRRSAARWTLVASGSMIALSLGTVVRYLLWHTPGIFLNDLTDERFKIPIQQGMLFSGIDPYAHIACGTGYQGVVSCTYFWQMPATLLFSVPGLDYAVVTLVVWVASLWIVRRDPILLMVIGGTYFGLMAANGYSDMVALFLLLVGTTYRGHLWADAIAIGCKQFAATLLALVYLAEKNWRRLALTIVVFGAWAIPFVLWNPTAFYCHALVFQIPTSCQGGIVSTSPFSGGVNFNYLLWPLFAVAIYRIPIWKWMHTTFRWMTRPDSLLGNYGVYLGIGSLSAGVNLLAFLLTSGHMAIIAASVTASTIAGVVAFIGHYHGTFRERHTRPWTHHLGFFVPIAILSIAINAILASVLSGHGMIPWAAQGVGLMCGSVAGFGANRRFNFHHKTVVQEDA